ncbi:hypothetical protein C1I98_04140 [Spongiactinospora gelatinilytica]|uniref:Uncharacterized protein n=1 Tax=Spongiactinospora gelatinilytica TaxID=2666298 RepID=A0A2W2HUX1_9ACTN|nr:hypothetical protein C1I98_04140 [Spongiactinospora gelatinilytica]
MSARYVMDRSAPGVTLSRSWFTAASSSASSDPSRAVPGSSRGDTKVRIRSTLGAACRRPTAEAMPAAAGKITSPMPRLRASRAAWVGPAPPKATRVRSRGSRPRSIDTARMACSMFAVTAS